MVFRLKFNQLGLNLSEVFHPVMTRMGRCFTFNSPQVNHTFESMRAGARFGLYLIIKIESDEYFAGPESSSGVKVPSSHNIDPTETFNQIIKFYYYLWNTDYDIIPHHVGACARTHCTSYDK